MRLNKKIIKLSEKYPTPFLLVDLNQVVKNYRRIKLSINNVEVFYAVKANDHPAILKTLAKEGASFEITSISELKSVLKIRTSASKIMCLNPIKSPDLLSEIHKTDVSAIAFDSFEEVDKMAKFAPKSKVVLRISVSNEGSDWPLTGKFGADAAEALMLFKYAKRKQLEPVGLTFHVGSQCINKNNWSSALYICDDIWNQAKDKGFTFNLLSLGGGIPIKHLKTIPSVKEISATIDKVIKTNFKTQNDDLKLVIEPGRSLIGDAAIMVTKVIGKAARGNVNWLYIDVGVFNGLMETVADFGYEIKTEKKRAQKIVTIGGPSCDSLDIPFKNMQVGDVRIGENLYILNAGAYTTVYASKFNGFEIPKTYFINNLK